MPATSVADIDEVANLIDDAASPLVLIFDVDNTIVRQGAGPDEFAVAVHDARDRFAALPSVERVILLTNGPERGVPWLESRGNKPWTSRRRLGLREWEGEVWVVGDQVVTDGALAWRLGARFVHLVIDADGEAKRQATMRRIGRRLEPVFFSEWPG